MGVIFKQKSSKFVRQNRENGVIAQLASVPLMDFAVIQGIIPPVLPSASHQRVHDLTTYLGKEMNYNVENANNVDYFGNNSVIMAIKPISVIIVS